MFWCLFVCLMVFNATFNNISAISWPSVLLVKETGGPGENLSQVTDKFLSHNGVLLAPIEIRTHNISGIGTNRVGSCKSNYHTITATTAPQMFWDILTKYFTTYRITRTKRGWFGSCSFHGFRVLPLFTVDWKRRHSSPMDTLKAEAFQSYGYTENGGIPVQWIHSIFPERWNISFFFLYKILSLQWIIILKRSFSRFIAICIYN